MPDESFLKGGRGEPGPPGLVSIGPGGSGEGEGAVGMVRQGERGAPTHQTMNKAGGPESVRRRGKEQEVRQKAPQKA